MNSKKLNELRTIADLVIEKAIALGADESKVFISESIGQSLQCRQGNLEELTREQDLSLSLVVYKDKRRGNVSISDKTEDGIAEAVKAAMTSAEFTEIDEYSGLTEAQYYANISENVLAELSLYHKPLPDIEQLKSVAMQAEQAAFDYDKRIVNSEGAGAYAIENYLWLKTSNGFSNGMQTTRSGINVSVMGKSGNDQQSNYAYDSHCDFKSLQTAEEIGRKAAEKTIASLNPASIDTGKYPVLFSPEMSSGLINHFLQSIKGVTQYRKLGFLPDCIDQQVFPEWLSLIEQPHLIQGSSSSLFDCDGVGVNDIDIVHSGKVNRYLLDAYSARRLNLKPTGNCSGVHNLKFCADTHTYSYEDLLKNMHKGILVTSLMGQGVNGLTGDYSRGASGFWIDNGQIQYPVEGLTIAGNLKDMFKQIAAIGKDVDTKGKIHAPSLLLESMTVAK